MKILKLRQTDFLSLNGKQISTRANSLRFSFRSRVKLFHSFRMTWVSWDLDIVLLKTRSAGSCSFCLVKAEKIKKNHLFTERKSYQWKVHCHGNKHWQCLQKKSMRRNTWNVAKKRCVKGKKVSCHDAETHIRKCEEMIK